MAQKKKFLESNPQHSTTGSIALIFSVNKQQKKNEEIYRISAIYWKQDLILVINKFVLHRKKQKHDRGCFFWNKLDLKLEDPKWAQKDGFWTDGGAFFELRRSVGGDRCISWLCWRRTCRWTRNKLGKGGRLAALPSCRCTCLRGQRSCRRGESCRRRKRWRGSGFRAWKRRLRRLQLSEKRKINMSLIFWGKSEIYSHQKLL